MMTAKEALRTKYTGSDEKGNMLLAYTGEQVEIFKKTIESHEQLVKDVNRYFELDNQAKQKWGNGIDDIEAVEYTRLHIKLSKL